ncbi:hypothetical protein Cni_G20867 [Canna indica]|uniref:Uncharacterized protein n=1 Tax=Canna indica TaxID=4628 RepID=A0AAQ3KNH9_9LILI|nr:hypothetical protein Cni_G20867 [Canna indica]
MRLCEGKDDRSATLQKKEVEGTLLQSFMDDKASIITNQFGAECIDALLHHPPDNSKEENTSYSDKAVIQIKVPDMIVFSKDDTIPIVKDICMDEVSDKTSVNKVLLENKVSEETYVDKVLLENKVTKKTSFDKELLEDEVSEKTSISATSMDDPLADRVPPSKQEVKFISAVDKAIYEQNSSYKLSEVGTTPKTVDQFNSDHPFPETSLQVMLSSGDSDKNHHPVDPTGCDFSCDHKECIDQEKIGQNKIEDTCSTTTSLLLGAGESSKSIEVMEDFTDYAPKALNSIATDMISDARTSNPSKIVQSPASDDGEVILNNSSFESEATTSREERRENRDSPEILQVQNCSIPDAISAPARSSFYHENPGDLNFSGPKGSSGHIAYSGNISMRSDSSTASTRSFAFPILQTEWHTSPVKMTKARKHRSWMGFICCKF